MNGDFFLDLQMRFIIAGSLFSIIVLMMMIVIQLQKRNQLLKQKKGWAYFRAFLYIITTFTPCYVSYNMLYYGLYVTQGYTTV